MEAFFKVLKFGAADIITTSGSIEDELLNNTDKDQSGWTEEEILD